jgi:flavin-dependent dehydrogenase
MWGKRGFFTGVQARAYLKNDNIVEFFPGIGAIAWIVPESKKIVRIGIMARRRVDFNKLLKSKLGTGFEAKIIEKQGGLIPIYNPFLRTQKENVFLVGDAATMVKATTGGGIIQGLIGAKALSDAIISDKSYQKEWKKRIGKDLLLALLLRRMMDNFSEKDFDLIIRLTKNKKVLGLLNKYDRDYPSKLLVRMAFAEPRYMLFLKNLIG